MKNSSLGWVLAGLFALGSSGCVFVSVEGGLENGFWDEDDGDDVSGFHDLARAVEGSLVDPKYDLDLQANPWRTEAEWTVSYASAGSDGDTAFHKVKEAVLERIRREGGHVRGEHDEGPHAWSCEFHLDGEKGEASVRLVEDTDASSDRSHQLEVTWEKSN